MLYPHLDTTLVGIFEMNVNRKDTRTSRKICLKVTLKVLE